MKENELFAFLIHDSLTLNMLDSYHSSFQYSPYLFSSTSSTFINIVQGISSNLNKRYFYEVHNILKLRQIDFTNKDQASSVSLSFLACGKINKRLGD